MKQSPPNGSSPTAGLSITDNRWQQFLTYVGERKAFHERQAAVCQRVLRGTATQDEVDELYDSLKRLQGGFGCASLQHFSVGASWRVGRRRPGGHSIRYRE